MSILKISVCETAQQKKRTSSIHPHINCWCLPFVVACLLPHVCLFASLADSGPGQAGWCARRCRVNFWLPLFVFKGTTAALHWRWRGLWCLAVREREAGPSRHATKGNQFFSDYSIDSMHHLIHLGYLFSISFFSMTAREWWLERALQNQWTNIEMKLKLWLIHRHDLELLHFIIHRSSLNESTLPNIINYSESNRMELNQAGGRDLRVAPVHVASRRVINSARHATV